MARELKQIISPQQLSASTVIYYTVPVNRTTTITRISFTNTTVTDRFVNVWLVPNGGSPVDSNKIVAGEYIAAGETFSPLQLEGQTLPAGSTIRSAAEVATAITVIGSGTEVTI